MSSPRATTTLCKGDQADIVRGNAEEGPSSNGARLVVTLGPAAHERLLVTQRVLRAASRSPTLPAVQHRINPMRRLLAAFILAGRPDGRRVRKRLCKSSLGSRRRGIVCSVRFSVPGVMDRLKGRRGPTIFLAEGPKKIVTPIAAARSRLSAIP